MADSDYSESATGTYAQIVVPSYELENPVTSSEAGGTTTGSSFIRLGSFPSLTDSSAQPSGFSNSLKLAQLVGGTATTYPSTTAALAENLSESADEAPTGLAEESAYGGDANYLLGFADDTRARDGADPSTTFIDWVSVSNTVENRQAETNRLLFKGGWWDHADGNRISTTSGDKIEVIQGNYKMVVLGRQDPSKTDPETLAKNAYIADASGGQIVAQDAGPSPNVLSVDWVEEDGAWTMYQDNTQNGNITTRTYGKQAQYFKGSKMYTEIGKDPGKYDGNLSHGTTSDDPNITNYTWAKRIETYLGAGGKPVDEYYYWIHALAINNVQTAIEITNTYFATTWELTIGAKTAVVVGPAVDIVAGPKLDVGLVKFQYLNGKNVYASSTNEASLLRTELDVIRLAIGETATRLMKADTRLTAKTTAIDGSVTRVAADLTVLNGKHMELAEAHEEVALDVFVMSALGTHIV